MKTNTLFHQQKELRPVPGFAGFWVSAFGDVFSAKSRNGRGALKTENLRRINPETDRYGYLRINPYGSKHLSVHRAVLLAWDRDPLDGEECRHLNGDKTDNRICNLKWGTQQENARDRATHGSAKGERNGQSKLTGERVLALRAEYVHKPLSQLLRENPDLSKFCLWAAVSGYSWQHLPGAIPKNRRCSTQTAKLGRQFRQ